jgi:GNAT acetyltransferase-like protein
MTDPSNALQSFQQGLPQLRKRLRPGVLDPNLYLYVENPGGGGQGRLTYVRLEGKTVTAFVEFVPYDPIEGMPCFNIGYAVPHAYRNQGRAKEVVKAALAEMQHGFGRVFPVFYVEAIIGADNKQSQRIAEQLISDTPVSMTDEISGLPALQYVRKFESK